MNWEAVVSEVTPSLFRIESQYGQGTGFVMHYSSGGNLCCVATAAHVVSDADEWEQPLRLVHHASGSVSFLKAKEIVLFVDKYRDSAVILFKKPDCELPDSPISLLPDNSKLKDWFRGGLAGLPTHCV